MSDNSLQALVDDLRALSDRELERTLTRLTVIERTEVLRLLEVQASALLSFDALTDLSPWLLKRIEAARLGQLVMGGRAVMTAAVANALIDQVTKRAAQSGVVQPEAVTGPGHRSWWRSFTRKRAA